MLGQQTAGRRIRLPWRGTDPQVLIVVGSLGVLLAFLVLVPLILVLWFSLRTAGPGEPGGTFTLENYAETFLNPLTYELLINTFWFSLGSVIVGLVIGVGFAWLIERTNTPLRNFGFVSIVINSAMPASMFAIAWVLVLNPRTGVVNMPFTVLLDWDKGPFNPNTLGSMIFVEGLRLAATIFLMVIGLFRSMDPSLEEASAMSQVGTLKTARHITLPIMTPGILGVVVYVATSTVGVFEIPGVMGLPADIHMLATRIFLATSQSPPELRVRYQPGYDCGNPWYRWDHHLSPGNPNPAALRHGNGQGLSSQTHRTEFERESDQHDADHPFLHPDLWPPDARPDLGEPDSFLPDAPSQCVQIREPRLLPVHPLRAGEA